MAYASPPLTITDRGAARAGAHAAAARSPARRRERVRRWEAALLWLLLAVVLLAVLTGAALRAMRAKGKGDALVGLIEEGFTLLTLLLEWLITIVPFAVFGVVAKVVGASGFAIFASLGMLVATVALGLAVHVFGYYGLLAVALARMSPVRFFRAAYEAGSGLAYVVVTNEKGEERIYRYGDASREAAKKDKRGFMLFTCAAPHVFETDRVSHRAALAGAKVVHAGEPDFADLDAKYLKGCRNPFVKSAVPQQAK